METVGLDRLMEGLEDNWRFYENRDEQKLFKYVWLGRWETLKKELESFMSENPFWEIQLSPYRTVTPLSLACQFGDLEFVKNVDPTSKGCSERILHATMLECARNNHQDCLVHLMEGVFLRNAFDRDTWEPIRHGKDFLLTFERQEQYFALLQSHQFKDFLSLLLTEDNISYILQNIGSDIMNILITKGCHPSCIKILIQHGAYVRRPDSVNLTPLICAVLSQNTDCVLFLLTYGADMYEKTFYAVNRDKCDAFMVSACLQDTKILKELSKFHKKQKNERTLKFGWSALTFASYCGNTNSVSLLATQGFDTNKRDKLGTNLLQISMESGCHDCVMFLCIMISKHLWGNEQTIPDAFWSLQCWPCLEDFIVLVEHLELDVNAPLSNGRQLLGIAAMRGYGDIVEWLLDKGAKIDARDESRLTALILACFFDQESVVDILVKRGADVNIQYQDNQCALWYAVNCRLHDSDNESTFQGLSNIECLLDYGANIDATDIKGKTVLMVACQEIYNDVVELLVKRGANVNIQDCQGRGALWYSVNCQRCHYDMKDLPDLNNMQCLLDHGADIEATDKEGKTALMVACEEICNGAVELLLKRGASVNTGDCKGREALVYAVNNPYLNYDKEYYVSGLGNFQCLLEHGADVDATDSEGRTALMVACEKKYDDFVEQLVKRGANVNIKDSQRRGALWYSVNCQHRHYDVKDLPDLNNIRCLLEHGAAIDATDSEGRTALMVACVAIFDDAVELLLKRGANVNIQDLKGRGALWYAAACSLNQVRCLLEYGADVDATDSEGKTALMVACEKGIKDIIEFLLKRGADINIQDSKGQSALCFAVKCFWDYSFKCLQILLKAKADLEPKEYELKSVISEISSNDEELLCSLFSHGGLVENEYLKPMHKKAMAEKCTKSTHWLKCTLKHDVFEWDLTPIHYFSQAAFHVTSREVCPGKISYSNDLSLSPLLAAFICTNLLLVRYFFTNLYFFIEDYRALTTDGPTRTSIEEKIQHSPELSDLLHRLTSQPLSLQTLSFLAISKAISLSGPPCLRSQRVSCLHLPDMMRKALSFQTDLAKTCPVQTMTDFEPSLKPLFGSWSNEGTLCCFPPCRFCQELENKLSSSDDDPESEEPFWDDSDEY